MGTMQLNLGAVTLKGDLTLPDDAASLVLFAHGSGSSRRSPRNRFVAEALNDAGIATLLFDLLMPDEEYAGATSDVRFHIDLLANRLDWATRWVNRQARLRNLPLGYFGASTGAAAALVAAARHPDRVGAVVSRGGRPDLAGDSLEWIHSPTLLLVGGADRYVLTLNESAILRLGSAEHCLHIVPDAGHLFEEPGALAEVARHAVGWFTRYLVDTAPLNSFTPFHGRREPSSVRTSSSLT